MGWGPAELLSLTPEDLAFWSGAIDAGAKAIKASRGKS